MAGEPELARILLRQVFETLQRSMTARRGDDVVEIFISLADSRVRDGVEDICQEVHRDIGQADG